MDEIKKDADVIADASESPAPRKKPGRKPKAAVEAEAAPKKTMTKKTTTKKATTKKPADNATADEVTVKKTTRSRKVAAPAEPSVKTEAAGAPANQKKILLVGTEVMPFSSTGGLGDVMGSLPITLKAKYGEDADVRVVSPLYDSIRQEWVAQMKTEAVFGVQLAWRSLYCGVLSIVKDGVTFYFIDNEYYFKRGAIYGHFDDGERFAFFCHAVLDMMPHVDFYPDVLHANDWQSALSIIYLNTQYRSRWGYTYMKTVFTIHNIEYQGKFDFSILQDVFGLSPDLYELMEYDGCINLMKAAIECADRVTTVSPTYAQEIMTPQYSHRLNFILARNSGKVCGILNGIDTVYYNPESDPEIYHNFSADTCNQKKENKLAFQREFALPENPDAPMIAVVSRLAAHKGVDLVVEITRQLLDTNPDLQFVVLGTGEAQYEAWFRQLENDYHDRVRSFIMYNRGLSKKIYAAADLFLMPSRSEPCGLSQMIAARYGTIPVVRETGGLYDSIKPYYEDDEGMHGNGFTFANYSAYELEDRVKAALWLYSQSDKFMALVKRAMTTDFSWNVSAEHYMDMYRQIP